MSSSGLRGCPDLITRKIAAGLWPLCQIPAANVAQTSASNPRLFALENVALFPRGKHSEHGLAVSGKKSALISRNCSEIGRGQKAPVVSVSVRQCGSAAVRHNLTRDPVPLSGSPVGILAHNGTPAGKLRASGGCANSVREERRRQNHQSYSPSGRSYVGSAKDRVSRSKPRGDGAIPYRRHVERAEPAVPRHERQITLQRRKLFSRRDSLYPSRITTFLSFRLAIIGVYCSFDLEPEEKKNFSAMPDAVPPLHAWNFEYFDLECAEH